MDTPKFNQKDLSTIVGAESESATTRKKVQREAKGRARIPWG
jgi:hypothetical protein